MAHQLESRPWMWKVLPCVLACNTELVVAPLAIYTGVAKSYQELGAIMAFVGGASLVFYYFFVDQVELRAQRSPFAQNAERFSKGLVRYVVHHIVQRKERFLGELSDADGKAKWFISYLSRWGNVFKTFLLFFCGWCPMPVISGVAWVPALVASRKLRSPKSLAALIAGDVAKNFWFAYVWWKVRHQPSKLMHYLARPHVVYVLIATGVAYLFVWRITRPIEPHSQSTTIEEV